MRRRFAALIVLALGLGALSFPATIAGLLIAGSSIAISATWAIMLLALTAIGLFATIWSLRVLVRSN